LYVNVLYGLFSVQERGMLREIDVAALFYRKLHPHETYSHMADLLGVSKSAAFNASRRLEAAGLLHALPDGEQSVASGPAFEFLGFGLPYLCRAEPRRRARGVPTATRAIGEGAATLAAPEELVWPSPLGSTIGFAVEPLAPGAPRTPQLDPALYRLLALADVLRVGDAREREWARGLLADELGVVPLRRVDVGSISR
jgi:hypothetical protein